MKKDYSEELNIVQKSMSTDGMEWMKGIKDNFNDLFKKLASRIH